MKKQSSRNGNKPVTLSQLKQVVKGMMYSIDKRFEQVDKRFEQVDKRFEQVDKRFEQVDKRFEQVDRRFSVKDKHLEYCFAQIDQNFAVLNGKLAALVGMNALNIDRAVNALEERQNKKFDTILARMDAFLKRTEDNEQEILFLGKQHDDLAKYCRDKIDYPVYGRKL